MESRLFTYKERFLGHSLCVKFAECEFKVDFGPFKKGDTFPGITVDYHDGSISAYDTAGDLVKTAPFILAPMGTSWT